MKPCKKCGLSFDELNGAGLCESCASVSPPQQSDPQFSDLQRQVAQQNQTLNMLIGAIQQGSQQRPPAEQPQAPDRTAFNRRVLTDPASVLEEQRNQTLGQAAQIAQQMVGQAFAQDHETMVTVARTAARNQFEDDRQRLFDRYGSEIEREVYALQPQFHRNTNVWKAAAERVMGAHMREIIADQREAANPKPNAPAIRVVKNDGPGVPAARSAPAPAAEDPNEFRAQNGWSENDWARAKRITKLDDKRLMQAAKDFFNQGDAEDPTKPSSWDRYITFDDNTGQKGRRRAQARKAREAALAS